MVYHLAGGNRDYDLSLKGEYSTTFQGMDGEFSKVFVADTTTDGGRENCSCNTPCWPSCDC